MVRKLVGQAYRTDFVLAAFVTSEMFIIICRYCRAEAPRGPSQVADEISRRTLSASAGKSPSFGKR